MLQDDIEIDLDEVLDMDDESDRRTYISVSIFINSALEFAQDYHYCHNAIIFLYILFSGAIAHRWQPPMH